MAEQPTAAPAKKSPLLIIIIIGIVMLGGGLGAGWFLFAHNKTTQAAPEKVVEKKEPEFALHLESFTVNLNDQEENHFLRCTIDLSLAHPPKGAGKEGDANAGLPIARIRDTILSVITSAKANELLTVEGKAALKKNILAALKERTPEIEADDVYFTEFLVQR
jgi:flagellar basal body-associated protein FliL